MDDLLYREIILEHWQNPQNYGVLANAEIDIVEFNPLCGDEIRIMVKIKNKKIERISFVSTGCAISRASASLFIEMVKGKQIKHIKRMKPNDFLKTLEIEISPSRLKCALLAYSTLQKALR
ncbi:MAG: SUF system NifU family Fe-S cluster assembly protein [Candidatus Levybacteria bacterium RIFCSPHIGHO2_01_FULL_36_15]|nr:MAG: SUF system NifU family Fe-S cluster assembly protein [Candidatus Levybacteria bacterium RIFCSPHIGHO2_01_FULL_36_15]OGH37210.1 MAG: SUF system NifU family Fe-S cluster assembly protein [Candidatus Levybacteria bacterium RIFCSPLOWO2_01_FULL_36_10]